MENVLPDYLRWRTHELKGVPAGRSIDACAYCSIYDSRSAYIREFHDVVIGCVLQLFVRVEWELRYHRWKIRTVCELEGCAELLAYGMIWRWACFGAACGIVEWVYNRYDESWRVVREVVLRKIMLMYGQYFMVDGVWKLVTVFRLGSLYVRWCFRRVQYGYAIQKNYWSDG